MTTTKIPPPRKLTENEDMDSFDDWWFQAICYYGRDENFKEFFDTPDFTWQEKDVPNRYRKIVHFICAVLHKLALFQIIVNHI